MACATGTCNASGMCVGCVSGAECGDGDPCTRNTCTAGTCASMTISPDSVVAQTEWGRDGFCDDGTTLGYQRVEARCQGDTGSRSEVRAFLSFDTRSVPASATVQTAPLPGCHTNVNGPRASGLYDPSFAIPLACSAYGRAAAGPIATMPDGEGTFSLPVPTSSIDRAGETQDTLRYPEITCSPGTHEGDRWVTSTGDPLGSCPGSTPWTLTVTYCNEPF